MAPVEVRTIEIELGKTRHLFGVATNDTTPAIGENDTLEARCLFELGFRKSVARRHGSDWIEKIEIL